MNRHHKNFKYAFGMAVFTSVLFNVCLTPLSHSVRDSIIIFCGTLLFLILPFIIPTSLLEVEL